MVILAASICTKSGKALVSRQFRDISRIRIEGLLSAFPKLMNPKSQHTFVETDSVRYVYQPLETLFLLLITTKSSNIVEDLDTLQLLSLTVKDQCQNAITEDVVVDRAFDIMFAFDEVVSLGFKEKVNLENVRTILEMESHAEEVQNRIREENMKAAQAISKAKALSMIDPKNKKTGISSKSFIGGGPSSFEQSSSYSTPSESKYTGSGSNSSGGIGSSSYNNSSTTSSYQPTTTEAPSKQLNVSRMKLAPKSKQGANSLVKGLILSGEVEQEEEAPTGATANSNPATPNLNRQESYQEAVHVVVEEKIRAEVNRDGGGAKINIRGEMFLTVKEGTNPNIRLHVNKNRAPDSQFATNLNPMLDKKAFSDENTLCLKNAKKGFPTGGDLHKIFTWRLQNAEDESVLPLTVSCWPNASSDGTTVNVEYALTRKDIELNDLVIRVPIPAADKNTRVQVDSIEQGTYKYDSKASELVWTLDTIDGNNNDSGSLEFKVPRGDESGFFPIQVQFTSRDTLSRISVDSVSSVEGNDKIKHSSDSRLVVTEYTVV